MVRKHFKVNCVFFEVVVIPRRKRRRRIRFLPPQTYFKPMGISFRELREISLMIEEVESLRLKDLEGWDQEKCSQQMGISRATFQRILYSARKKVAQAIVEGKALRIIKDDFEVSPVQRFRCMNCGLEFERTIEQLAVNSNVICPKCGDEQVYCLDFIKPPGQP